MDNSIAYINSILKDLERIFRGSGDSELAPAAAKVQNYLEKIGIASKKSMMQQLHRHMTLETLERVLFTLEEIGFCEKCTQGKTTMWKHQNGRVKP